jgi:hypothetical protein
MVIVIACLSLPAIGAAHGYRSAHAFIQQHGEADVLGATMKADTMLDKGGLEGAAVWRRIVSAINDIQREEPARGELWH